MGLYCIYAPSTFDATNAKSNVWERDTKWLLITLTLNDPELRRTTTLSLLQFPWTTSGTLTLKDSSSVCSMFWNTRDLNVLELKSNSFVGSSAYVPRNLSSISARMDSYSIEDCPKFSVYIVFCLSLIADCICFRVVCLELLRKTSSMFLIKFTLFDKHQCPSRRTQAMVFQSLYDWEV